MIESVEKLTKSGEGTAKSGESLAGNGINSIRSELNYLCVPFPDMVDSNSSVIWWLWMCERYIDVRRPRIVYVQCEEFIATVLVWSPRGQKWRLPILTHRGWSTLTNEKAFKALETMYKYSSFQQLLADNFELFL